jgi:hypothetical protein
MVKIIKTYKILAASVRSLRRIKFYSYLKLKEHEKKPVNHLVYRG